MARPTILTQDLIDFAKTYLESCEDEELQNGRVKVTLPNIAALARYIGVARSTVYKWAEENDEFSDILDEVLAEQENKLINNGLSGTYNSTITKVIMTKHGYSDKVEMTGKDGKDLIPDKQSQEKADSALESFLGKPTE